MSRPEGYAPSGNLRDWDERRKPINDRTAERATRSGEPWTNADDARVLTWDHTEPGLEALALEMGRTLEACRQRFYSLHREPRDRATGTSRQPRQRRASQTSSEPSLGAPCPVCGLHHPGEC